MKFDSEINKYISGELFSPGLDIYFSLDKYPDQTRISKILEITKNKRVIHVGCADHLPLIDEKIRTRKWLHGLLIENSEHCIGVDIDKKAVDYITNKLGIKDVYCFNILNDNLILQDNLHWDYMILGEIIEHVDNPVAFLQALQKRYVGKIDKILITAPNVFNNLTIKSIKNNIENINTDHRYWFSPFTLMKIVTKSEFINCELFYIERVKLSFLNAIVKRLKALVGLSSLFRARFFSTIMLIADFK